VTTISRAAAQVFCSRSQFDQYLAQGVVTRKPAGQYNLDEVRREVFAYLRKVAAGCGTGANADRLTDERMLWTRAKRRREEMAEAVAKGKFVSAKAVTHVVGSYVSQCRERLLSLPGKWAALLAFRDAAEIDDALTSEIYEVLDDLSEQKIFADIAEHEREGRPHRSRVNRTNGAGDSDDSDGVGLEA
jgi:phage terminase Nu1 subunit (DNA packaging protein)